MTKQRIPFMPVTPDFDDDQLERLARDKGVGAMVKPAEAERRADTPAGQGAQASSTKPMAATKPKAEKPRAGIATPRSEMKTVNLELPAYVWTDLKIRAAHQQTSVRHIVMTALRKDGIKIEDVDMVEDGRRARGSNKPD